MIHRRRTFQIAPGRQADAITLLHEFNSLDKDIGNIGLRVSVVTTGTLGRIYHHADLESMAAFETAGRPSGPLWMSPGSSPPTMWPNVPSGLPACRPVAQGGFRHAVREWRTVCRRHADGRGDLPDARPGPVRLPGRGLHREHGRPCRPPAPPRPRLIPSCTGRGRTSHQLRVPN